MLRTKSFLSCLFCSLILLVAGVFSGCPRIATLPNAAPPAVDHRESDTHHVASLGPERSDVDTVVRNDIDNKPRDSMAFQPSTHAKASTGCVMVRIRPKAARQAGARWRVDGGSWTRSGKTVCNLSLGRHSISFKDIAGWTPPGDKKVSVVANETASRAGRYSPDPTGSVQVTILPDAAAQAGAQWCVDGGEWHNSGVIQGEVSVGGHTVNFKDIAGWVTPDPQDIDVQADQTATTDGTYTFETETTFMLPGDVPLLMVWVPAGSFMMGRFTNEQASTSNEDPQHQVTFASGFWMGKYEVTQAQWVALMGSNPSNYKGDLSRPVEQVSWNDAQACIAVLNTHVVGTGQGAGTFHLPSEAQWEYACRAGTTTRFYWGDDANYTQIVDYAWYTGNASSATHPVGQKLPNAWGLCDMAGNVLEFCEDWSHSNYTGAPTDGSAWVLPTDSARMNRGGAFSQLAEECRSAARSNALPDGTGPNIGFRLAR